MSSGAIRELPASERPMERLLQFGPEALSAAELVAVIIRCGMQGQNAVQVGAGLMARFGSPRKLATATPMELAALPGIGLVRAAQIQAAIELGRRVLSGQGEQRGSISGPRDAAQALMPTMRYLEREEFRALFLDSRNRLLDVVTISVGTLDSSIVHPREVFRAAIRAGSASLIVAHNHPSGDPTPSPEDLAITRRLCTAGALIGIDVVDHIIIGDNVYVSLKEKGLLERVT
ncbi:MAG: DNA repair protein RadC [Bacillota bacterium]|jgi:DNA repair protein RadC|nr:DNA repair protein RadC [Bacillota bacterium]